MSPEAVCGHVTGIETDLWALGVVIYQMFAGYSAFHSQSPYLTFLRIKRAQLRLLSPAVIPRSAAELISKLVVRDRSERLRNALGPNLPLLPAEPPNTDHIGDNPQATVFHKSIERLPRLDYSQVNYDPLRALPFFSRVERSTDGEDERYAVANFRDIVNAPAVNTCLLKELSLRAVSKAVVLAADLIAKNGGSKPPSQKWLQVIAGNCYYPILSRLSLSLASDLALTPCYSPLLHVIVLLYRPRCSRSIFNGSHPRTASACCTC